MKWLLAVGGLVFVIWTTYLIFNKENTIVNYPPKEGPIVAFGDSLVYGVGAEKSENFVAILSKQLSEPIVNMGVPGDTTRDGLARLDEVLKREPRIVVVLLGGNDRLKQVPLEETLSNMRTIIERLQESGAVVVLLGVRGNLLSDRFEDEYERLAEETGSLFVPDVLDGIFGEASLMADGIHPNAAGYAKIADKIHSHITRLLK